MSKILWVTSFNKRLYEHSGRKLLDTFVRHKPPGDIFIAHEDKLAVEITRQVEQSGSNKKEWLFDLEDSETLLNWLRENKDIIPVHLGGKAIVCKCKGGANPAPPTKHSNPGCHWTWWNRNCSRWFRKIPALKQAWELDDYRYIIWIDCDCYFTEEAKEFNWKSIIGNSPGFFMKGPRAVMEGGVVGYDKESKVGRFVHDQIEEMYLSGTFRDHYRWDDSFIVQIAIENARRTFPEKKQFFDVAGHLVVKDGHVTKKSLIGKHIRHNKGEHAREGLTG